MAARKPTTGRGGFQDIEGRTFNRLTVRELVGRNKQGACLWRCACDCGGEVVETTAKIKDGERKSCGCMGRKGGRNAHHRHGRAGSHEHRVWSAIKTRCTNPRQPSWPNYGGRGIRMCEEWAASFERFFADMGSAPSTKHGIDRIDVNGHYEPGNVRWATNRENSRNRRDNRRITFRGETLTLAEWAERLGVNQPVLAARLDRLGWSLEKALTTPKMRRGRQSAPAAPA